jgi:hypothetical protein
MTEEIYNRSRINNSCRLRIENRNSKDDVEFIRVVKFLNAQKAVMDYAGLN